MTFRPPGDHPEETLLGWDGREDMVSAADVRAVVDHVVLGELGDPADQHAEQQDQRSPTQISDMLS
jgi:hypothetical protein